MSVRMIDLCEPLQGLDDVVDHARVRVFVALNGRPIGSVDIDNRHRPVSPARVREAIVDQLGLTLLGDPKLSLYTLSENAKAALRQHYLTTPDGSAETPERLPDDVPVSIIVATYDRPNALRECLLHLTAQESARSVEIVVVDNHPDSGLTPPVVAEFPEVKLGTETRQGLAYARNKGFNMSCGEIVIATDDDVLVPPDWLEKIVAPFVHHDVMAVTGNVLPFELETTAQREFERYGGLGRGFIPKEVGLEWFHSFRRRAVPTWELGATANAAFRASIFTHPEIGLMDEALGPGTPTGVGEDIYLFYKILRAGYTIVYEPSAYVWHKHRREMTALYKQLYDYSKGYIAYNLTTMLRYRDLRVVGELMVRLPLWRLRQLASYIRRRLRRSSYYPWGPLRLVLIEITGNLAGPWSLWRSYRRVKREGRSDTYVPIHQRTAARGSLQEDIRSST